MLFIDAEWNQIGKRLGPSDEILEIAALSSMGEYVVDRYFKYIKPVKKVKRQTFNFLGVTPNDLNHGESIENVLKVLQALWNESDCIVVWSNDALNIIKSTCVRRNISLAFTTVIILQNLLSEILVDKSNLSFEGALLKFGALYDRTKMHHAKFDAECLKSLFEIVCNKYENILIQDTNSNFVESKKTKTVHRTDCKYVGNIRDTNIVQVPVYRILAGEKQCKCCMPDRLSIELESADDGEYERIKSVRNLKGKRVDYEQIGLLIEFFQLQCIQSHDYFLVTTEYSMWKIYYAEGFVTKLEHENYKNKNDKRGYHNQHIRTKDMFSVMEYIVNHDKKPYKKKRVVEFEKTLNREVKRKRMQKERRVYDDDELENWKKYVVN